MRKVMFCVVLLFGIGCRGTGCSMDGSRGLISVTPNTNCAPGAGTCAPPCAPPCPKVEKKESVKAPPPEEKPVTAAAVANDIEVLKFIGERKLPGSGIGYIDAHLLAATALTPETTIWTRDKRLRAVARSLSLAADIRE